jgi:molybdopterin-guanine dinucleotide biosynthesis protein A
MATFAAALIAGGKSTRLGRDKALLPVPGSDLLLWQRQLAILESLAPVELLWSGPAREGLPPMVRAIADAAEGAGPLAGLCACLESMQADLLVVLAVDLPRMETSFLQRLMSHASPGCGVVARQGDRVEPLAAVYPRELAALARERLHAGQRALHDLVFEAAARGLVRLTEVTAQEKPLLMNLNTPEDHAAWQAS